MIFGMVESGCGLVCVCVCQLVYVCACMLNTHGGGSLRQCVHVGGCVCQVVRVCVCFSVAGVCA